MRNNTIKFARRKKADVFGRGLRRGYSGRKLLKTLFWRKRRRRHKAAIFIFNVYDFGGKKFKRKKLTRFGRLLIEKQKLRAFYSFLTQKQLKSYLKKAVNLYPANMSGRSLIFDIFFSCLESRLDVAVYRLHFARTLQESRQFVSHKKVLVNGHVVNRGGYTLLPGDKVELLSSCKFNLAKCLFNRAVASDSGLRRRRVSVLLRGIYKKRHTKYELIFKGFSLKYFWLFKEQGWDQRYNPLRDAQEVVQGFRKGLRFMQKMSYDSIVLPYLARKPRGLQGVFQYEKWERPLYLSPQIYSFVSGLANKNIARWFYGTSVRTICNNFTFRSNWYVSKKFKRRGRFRRQLAFVKKEVFYIIFKRSVDKKINSKILMSSLRRVRGKYFRRGAAVFKERFLRRYKRRYRRTLSRRTYRLLKYLLFGFRRNIFNYASFPLLFPIPKMYEVDYRSLVGIYVGSYSYKYIPFTAHIRPYFFYQFYVKNVI